MFKSRGLTAFLKPSSVSAFKMVPINDSFWGKNEFLKNSELHCTVLEHLLLLVTCLSMILWVSKSLKCQDLIWRLPRTGVK